MASETTILHLTKEEGTEYYNVNTVNENSDKIDEWAGKVNEGLNERVEKSSIINNCNITEEGFIGDARQLHYLKGLIVLIDNTENFVNDLNDASLGIINKYNDSTLNTPYTQGLTTATVGICLNFLNGSLQVAFSYKANAIFMRYDKGSWSKLV